MGDSSSFSSLFALVDNHLSKSNIQHDDDQPSTNQMGAFKLPAFNVQRGLSDTGLATSSLRFPTPSLSLSDNPLKNVLGKQFTTVFNQSESEEEDDDTEEKPSISMSDCPINDVLAIQLSNMFKAREAKEEEKKRRQEEQKKVEENLQKLRLEESSCLIDLMSAIQIPGQVRPQNVEILSSGSSMESVVLDAADSIEDKHQEGIEQMELHDRPVSPLKPINTDISYILKHKIGKCSEFGKVLCARYRPVAAPYLRVHIPHNIKVFDFSTPSPDDIILERLKKPSYYNTSSSTVTVYE